MAAYETYCIHKWDFNVTPVANISDSIGSLTMTQNNCSSVATGFGGYYCYQFDGSSSYLVSGTSTLGQGNTWTIEILAAVTTSQNGVLFSRDRYVAGMYGYEFGYNTASGKYIQGLNSGGSVELDRGTDITSNQVYHWFWTCNSSGGSNNWNFYEVQSGTPTLIASFTYAGTLTDATYADLDIGKEVLGSSQTYLKGNVYLIRVHNAVLTTAQMTQNYNAESPRYSITNVSVNLTVIPTATTATNAPTFQQATTLTAPGGTTSTNAPTQAIAGPTLTAPGGTTSTTAPTRSLATTLVEPAATTTTYAPTFAQATTISTTPAATTATNPPSPDVAPVIVAPTGTTSTSAPTFAQATTLTAPGGTTTTNAPTQAVAGPMLTSPTATTATDAPSLAVGIILESPTATTATTGTLIISQWGAIEIIHATYITTSRLSGVSKKTEGITAIKPVVTGGLRATCDLKIPHLTAVSKNSGVLTAISEVIS